MCFSKLYHGDCLEVMQRFANKGIKFDAIITDPPYGTTACKWDIIIPFDKMWDCLNNLIKDNGVICLFGSEPFSSFLRCSNIEYFKYDWIWEKTKAGNFASCRKNPMKYHENISVFYKQFPTYNLWNLKQIAPIKSGRKNKGSKLGHCSGVSTEYFQTETGFHSSILKFSNKSGKGYSFHPTQKPVDLLEYLIKTYTNEGDTVLDFTMGSGTTGVACKNLHRNFVGIELDDKYFEIAKQRIFGKGKGND